MLSFHPIVCLCGVLALTVPDTAFAHDDPGSRELLYSDDFTGRTELGKNYFIGKATSEAFAVSDGVLVCRQTQDDHGAHMGHKIAFGDVEIEVDFRFNGGSRFNLVINDKKDKTVHAGHICRVSISPKQLLVGDDKTGKMNLKVCELRQTKDLPADKAKQLQELIQRTEKTTKIKLQQGQWYRLRVVIKADVIEAHIDGKLIASLKSPGIARAEKTDFGVTVNGSTIDFDNLQVYAAKK